MLLLGGKFFALKKERLKISDLNFYLKKLKKRNETPKLRR